MTVGDFANAKYRVIGIIVSKLNGLLRIWH
jgi:hypothetical protein